LGEAFGEACGTGDVGDRSGIGDLEDQPVGRNARLAQPALDNLD